MRNNNNQKQFLFLILFVFFTGSVAFAQNATANSSLNEVLINPNDNAVGTATSKVSSELNSNMNFILWFMGTKEDVNSAKSSERFYTKKSILTSGREPNHLLLKTLLKKTINNESC
ncbi:hypothetical protein [Flavobacterium gilvum]|uniref:Uncharacterized protein n=1 Tax=Flavobacterium gilvum TaxID=1492737 RepID=A0AAC9I2J1_9FLAO|nr:hypothetical protein [Flavobacterium gilvum]AOW09459.1 hypothetical protein EM308_08075 [Flavobacterium gilvum]KFC58385.1 hypothetical protein FEM08_28100 [Flavobacterium gilvum]